MGALVGFLGYSAVYLLWLASLYPDHYICSIGGANEGYACIFSEFFFSTLFSFSVELTIITVLLTILGGLFSLTHHKLSSNFLSKRFWTRVIVNALLLALIVIFVFSLFGKGLGYLNTKELTCRYWENSQSCSIFEYIFTNTLYDIFLISALAGIIIYPTCLLGVLVYELLKKRWK